MQVILLGLALSMDAFSVSITDGLIYSNIDKRKSIFIALVFGFMQALMPLIGYFIVDLVSLIVGQAAGEEAGKIMGLVVAWVAFALLIILGAKMIIEGIISIRKPEEEKQVKYFSIKEVLYFGVVTSIDALGTGVAMHSGISTNYTIWLHVSIIMVITFILSIIGLALGHIIVKIFKGKYEITSIIGGAILIALAIWIIIENYA